MPTGRFREIGASVSGMVLGDRFLYLLGGKEIRSGGAVYASEEEEAMRIKERKGENKPVVCMHHAVETYVRGQGDPFYHQTYPTREQDLVIEVYQNLNGEPSEVLTVVCRLVGTETVTEVYPTGQCDVQPFVIL